MRNAIAVLLCALVACGGSGDRELGADAGPPDAVPDADPTCHVDCFGRHECRDGVVTSWAHAPVPCAEWTGACPSAESYRCQRGCRIDGSVSQVPDLAPETLCEENRPKQVGDVCVDDSGCRPEVADVDRDGVVTNVYLRCGAAGRCEDRPPPTVVDWLAPCGLTLDDGLGSAGVVSTEACSGGACLFAASATCMRQGCTTACTSDGDCPPGAICEPGWTVCKPGPPRQLGVGLTCP